MLLRTGAQLLWSPKLRSIPPHQSQSFQPMTGSVTHVGGLQLVKLHDQEIVHTAIRCVSNVNNADSHQALSMCLSVAVQCLPLPHWCWCGPVAWSGSDQAAATARCWATPATGWRRLCGHPWQPQSASWSHPKTDEIMRTSAPVGWQVNWHYLLSLCRLSSKAEIFFFNITRQ